MVREFQSVIGREARAQILEAGRPAARRRSSPASAAAATPWASSTPSSTIPSVRLVGVEAGGEGIAPGRHAARFAGGSAGVLQGTRTFVLQDDDGNIELTHSISAGLDYAAVGPEHAWLQQLGRAEYTLRHRRGGARRRSQRLAQLEGILPALESAHGVAYATGLARQLGPERIVLVNLSGRGDKDVETVEAREAVGATCRPGPDHDMSEKSEACPALRRCSPDCARTRQTGLVTYVTAGDPDRWRARGTCCARSARAGADVIEVGVPFSDPLADGPVIQRATERALARRRRRSTASLDLVADVRLGAGRPMVLFSYANPLVRMGVERFVERARGGGGRRRAGAGSAGRGGRRLPRHAGRRGHRHHLPAQPDDHAGTHQAGGPARAWLPVRHLRLGVTGARDPVADGAAELAARIRRETELPVALGFGISRPEHVREIGSLADAAVVGSGLVQVIADSGDTEALVPAVEQYVRWLRGVSPSPQASWRARSPA